MILRRIPNDGELHVQCMRCRREMVTERREGGKSFYGCRACGHVDMRALIFDPALNSWLDGSGEYWHHSAGVFVRNPKDKFLFLDRTKFPFGLTLPAGHVERNEKPRQSASREAGEEASLRLQPRSLKHIVTEDIRNDKCPRGSDAHRWDVYGVRVDPTPLVKVNSESSRAVWLDLDQALRANLTFPVRSLITKHRQKILRATS